MEEQSLFAGPADEERRTLAKSDRLLRVFEDIHNHIYANEGLSSEQTFAEMMKLLALKVCDEKAGDPREFYILPAEFDGPHSSGLKELEKRLNSLRKRVAERLPGNLAQTTDINLKPTSLAYAVDRLQHISLRESSRDVKGLAFQKFVCSEHRRDRGQFFTPEQVVDLCVRILQPKPTERVLDLACGTAGFLSRAWCFMLENASVRQRQTLVQEGGRNVYGIEINPMVAKTAQVRMALEDSDSSRITVADALSDWPSLNRAMNRVASDNCSYEGFFDVILTNPPFGTQGRITDTGALERFDLGHKWICSDGVFHKTKTLQPGQVPDILFIERCLDFLKVGGRMAIVLPNGDLENSSLAYLRRFILSRSHVLAVVHLPLDTFVPFGTGVRASVLFLQKVDVTARAPKAAPVFFGRITKLGYLAKKNGGAVYRKDKAGRVLTGEDGEAIVDEDVSVVVQNYEISRKDTGCAESDEAFTLPPEEMSDRFDLEYYKPSHRMLDKVLLSKGAKPLSLVVDIVKIKAPRLSQPDEEVLYVELSNVNVEYCELSGGETMQVHELPSRASFELHEGDIITAVAGNSIGTVKHMSAIVTKEYEGAICTNGFRILRPKKGIAPYYLLYFLRTSYFLEQVYRFRTGAAIPAISDEDLARVLVYIPPERMQAAITKKMVEGFELRRQSKELTRSIKFSIA